METVLTRRKCEDEGNEASEDNEDSVEKGTVMMMAKTRPLTYHGNEK